MQLYALLYGMYIYRVIIDFVSFYLFQTFKLDSAENADIFITSVLLL